ncbi:MAG: alkaline phosphatase family protein [Bacteroidales bacterium]|nr:alkaline phosphatase family protein [Bacteroidales bacterium]
MKKFIFILDALKANQLGLIQLNMSEKVHAVNVIPPFSFEPDASYLCGLHPEESNAGLKYWKTKNVNNSKIFHLLQILPNRPRIVRKIINKILKKTPLPSLKKYKNNYACIPFKMLKYFELSNESELFQKSSGSMPSTIFDSIQGDYCYMGVPYTSGQLDYIKTNLTQDKLKQYNTFFIYISDLDNTGHKYGGISAEYDTKLTEIIHYIKSVVTSFDKEEQVNYIIFGDHGMVNVKKYINLERILKKLPLQIEKDYIYFLDSTMARFWFYNEKAEKLIYHALAELEGGSWINDEDKTQYKIRYNHNKFGDAIWWVNDESIISPNFWQCEKKIKGMHGYRKNVNENHTCVISNQKLYNSTDTIEMIELNQILETFLKN